MLDANNVLDEEKDSKRSDKQTTYQTHPKGVAALRECLNKWGSLTDCYRELNIKGKETTHRQNIGRTPYRRAYTVFRRLDRIYVSRNMTLKDNPTITNIRHVIPTDGDLLALKRIGSTSKWSDHSAVEIRVRYTDTLKQKRPWTFPKHTLTNDLEEVTRIRESANTLLASIDNNMDPRKALSTWMEELKVHTENRSKEEKKIHIQKKPS